MSWDIKKIASSIVDLVGSVINFDSARTGYDFHTLGFFCAEVVIAGVNQTKRLLAAVGENQAVADDFTLKIDIGFGDGRDIAELVWNCGHERKG